MEQIVAAAHAVADAARAPTLAHFRSVDLAAENKQGDYFDPVTEGDRAAERAMRAVLAELRPEDAILGEEYGETSGTTGLTWVLDPIDGTRGYICGTPTWGVLIAAVSGDDVLCGVIDQPYIGERFIGARGTGDWIRGDQKRALQTRKTTDLSQARIMTTFPEVGRDQDRKGFEAVAKHAQFARYGMDCYGYALVAAGQIDLVIEAGLASYDIAGPIGVVHGAGGIVTSWSGGVATHGGQAVAAANAELHSKALELLAPYAD
ncbi:MAG: histidinol-phosphatase [Pseudomonadota bacterium]